MPNRLKGLIEHLGLNTLVITDIDAKTKEGKSVSPARNADYLARNETLKSWCPKEENFDILLDKAEDALSISDESGYGIRVAYQQPVKVMFKSEAPVELLANTFEDALVYENLSIFKDMEGAGLLGSFRKAIKDGASPADLAQRVFDGLAKGGKAEFAMELLYSTQIDSMTVPTYIDKGLAWLAEQLKRKEDDVLGKNAIALVVAPAGGAAQGNVTGAA